MPAPSDILIHAHDGDYRVRVGDGTFTALMDASDDPVIVDAALVDAVGHPDRVIPFEAVESRKTLAGVEEIIEALRDRGVTRGRSLIAVGGGIVQDVATAAASLYMRGLPWRYVPTTVLAMVDSCIGGKSSLNVGPYKNLAGNFHPPAEVVIDPRFIATLDDEARAGGLCEAMKITFCRGDGAYARYLDLVAAMRTDGEGAAPLIAHALASKKWFIEIDEFDQAERRQLNFGHTFAHALEAATGFGVSHGIAVGIGTVAAERLAVAVDGPEHARPELVAEAVRLVRQAGDLRARLAALDRERFRTAFLADKKHGADGLHVILPAHGGTTQERVLARSDVTLRTLEQALDEAIAMMVDP